jgi:hypothetical protein
VLEKYGLVVWRPTVMIPTPTRIADEEISVKHEAMTFVAVRPVLIRGATYIALEHEFVLMHIVTSL